MSWLADIAGKAENFLNNIDKNAAVALNTTIINEKQSRPIKSEPFIERAESESGRSLGVTSVVDNPPTLVLATNEKLSSSFTGTSSHGSRKTSKKQQSRTVSSSKPLNSNERTNETSAGSTKLKENLNLAKSLTVVSQNGVEKKSTNANIAGSIVKDKPNEDDLIAYLNSNDGTGGINESLILQDEVETQARELKLLTKNHRSLQKDYEDLKQKLNVYQEKLTNAESTRYSNEAEERDLRKLLEEKDSEIHSLSSRHQQALEALQKLELSQDNLQKLEQCVLENVHIKSENDSLLQRTEILSSQVETTETHLLSLKSTLSSMEKEFSNYKEKAKSILNYKDELIASLKGDGGGIAHSSNSNSSDELIAEITALKNERELLQADISQTRAIVESLKDDNIRLEKEVSTLRSFTEDLGSQLKMEKGSVAMLQSENLQVCQQLTSIQFELEREKNEKKKFENLVTQYKQASTSRNSSNHSFESRMNQNNGHVVGSSIIDDTEVSKLKTRVSALSQSLYEKQSLINDISTDKQLLQIEVERLKNDLRECRAESNEFCLGGGLPQTVIASQPLYLSESPWDSRVSARMKRIYTQLDAVFCQFGLALRKRPNLRLGMSLYVIFLHLWVFFVLFTWMHHAPPE